MEPDTQKMGRRERHKAVIREKLVDAARTAFVERGYLAATHNEIADAADVARTTAFNYFPHKKDFLVAILADRRAQIRATMTRILDEQRSIMDTLRAAMREFAAWFDANPKLTRALSRATLQSGVLLQPDYYATSDLFGAAIVAGQQRGEIRPEVDATLVGRLLMDGYLGVIYRWAADDRAPSPEQDLVRMVDIVVEGIRVPDMDGRTSR
ncbi:TetR/AcrR family transcriptional regulator [Micromonospora sp. NPDC049559]|uniref:TetR/AcrR family transcriptional regulator n=1 Tax=Micromonospora sp. NPDC049559 TaxID=3155923 RepID=UPI00341667F3